MPYAFSFSGLYQKTFINQLLAIIQRDQTNALALVNTARATLGNAALDPIQEFHKGSGTRTALPWLSFAAGPVRFDLESQELRSGEAVISLVLDVGQFDQELAQDNAFDYAMMLDGIVMTSWDQTPTDWVKALAVSHETVPNGTTAPPSGLSMRLVNISDIVPGITTLDTYDRPILRIVLPVLFEFEDQNVFQKE